MLAVMLANAIPRILAALQNQRALLVRLQPPAPVVWLACYPHP